MVNNLLFEDCKFSFYNDSTIEASGSGNVDFRQEHYLRIIGDTTGHSEGLFVDHVANLVFEQNLFDHNGYNDKIAGAEPTIFNHGLYVQYNNGQVTAIGNIFADTSATGAQFRTGGTILDNFFVDNPMGFQIGSSPAQSYTGPGLVGHGER